MRERVDDRVRAPREQRVDDREVRDLRDPEARVALPECGQPVELHPEHEHERVAEDEDRDRDPEERHHGDDAVHPAVRVARSQAAQRDAQADREDQGPDRQLDRAREADEERVGDRFPIDEARPEVAMQEPPEVVDVLDVEGLVKPERGPDLGSQLRRGVLSQDGLRGIARKQPQEQEQDDGEPKRTGMAPISPDDEPEHETTASSLRRAPEVPDLGGSRSMREDGRVARRL